MKFGIFNVPYALDYGHGTQPLQTVIDWNLQVTQWADQYGIDEVFFAEHYTLGHEPLPSPDLMIAAAAKLTNRVKLGALGHLLPYHHPAALAHRMLFLDHLTAGRYIAGVAPGAYPSDAQLFNTGKENPKMFVEALDIIHRIFTKAGPWRVEGDYWTVDMPAYDEKIAGPHLKPLEAGGPEIVMTGMSPQSATLTEAGRRNASPASQAVAVDFLRMHWTTYSEAARAAGHTPDRSRWRITREWIVADTDEEAREIALNGANARVWKEHNGPTFKALGLEPLLLGPDNGGVELTHEWLVDNFAFVGSPDTVAQKISDFYDAVGGFGTLLMGSPIPLEDPEPFRRSTELLATKVAPQLTHLTGEK